jgi:hypothetical protein
VSKGCARYGPLRSIGRLVEQRERLASTKHGKRESVDSAQDDNLTELMLQVMSCV